MEEHSEEFIWQSRLTSQIDRKRPAGSSCLYAAPACGPVCSGAVYLPAVPSKLEYSAVEDALLIASVVVHFQSLRDAGVSQGL